MGSAGPMTSSQDGDKEGDKGGYRQINKALNICAFDDYLKGQIANLPSIEAVEQLTPRVLRVLGQNPGKFTYQGTNTFICGTGSSRILVDTSGGEPEYATLLEATLEKLGISLQYVLITHWHGDHSGGVPDIVRMYPHLRQHIYKNDPEIGMQNIVDGQTFAVEGATIKALHAPGHSHDHMCFMLEEERSMFTGDNILGTGTSAVEDLGLFMSSLQKMTDQNCITGHPAHGVTIADLRGKIARELEFKMRRERQVLAALARLGDEPNSPRAKAASVSVRDVVTGIYGDAVDEQTRTLALEPFIDEVLRKLAGDGKVGFAMRKGKKTWHLLPPAMAVRPLQPRSVSSPVVTSPIPPVRPVRTLATRSKTSSVMTKGAIPMRGVRISVQEVVVEE